MKVQKWLDQVAFIDASEIEDDLGKIYYSNFDKSYITRVGMEHTVKFLAKKEITEQLTHGVGFSPKDNKWYGWSHRAIYGFEIGSTCERGNCHYNPIDKEDFLNSVVSFWTQDDHLNISAKHTLQEIMTCEPINPGEPEQKSVGTGRFEKGVYVEWTYADTIPNEKLHNTISGIFTSYPETYGRGEWVAKTMEDAKQMAIDFNEGVS